MKFSSTLLIPMLFLSNASHVHSTITLGFMESLECRFVELAVDLPNDQSAFEAKCQSEDGELFTVDDNNHVLPDLGENGLNIMHNSGRYQITFTNIMVNNAPVITTTPTTRIASLIDLETQEEVDIGSFAVEENGRRRIVAEEEDMIVRRRLGKVQGESTMAIVRVSGKNGIQPLKSVDGLANTFFGINNPNGQYFARRYELCSFGKKTFVPASDSLGNFVNGVTEIEITSIITGKNVHSVVNKIILALEAKFTYHLFNKFDNVVFVMPYGSTFNEGGTPDWMAFAYINQYLSVFNDQNVVYLSHQVHEVGHNLGLLHSSHDDQDYGDQSGIMGYGYTEEGAPQMCFNGAKSWFLGWYNDKAIEIDLDSISRRSIYLSFFGDYARVPTRSSTDVVLIKIGHYYMIYNLKKGINVGTKEFGNSVTVTYNDSFNELSVSKAALNEGQPYNLGGGFNFQFCAKTTTSSGVDQAQISLHRNGESSTCGSSFDSYLVEEENIRPEPQPTPDATNRPLPAVNPRPPSTPTPYPTRMPTKVPSTPEPTWIIFDGTCHACDDRPMDWFSYLGCAHEDSAYVIQTKCNKNGSWRSNKYCQLTCFQAGFGYDGDNCCRTSTGDIEPTPGPTAAPTAFPTHLPTPPPPTPAPTVAPIPDPTPEPTLSARQVGCADDEMAILVEIFTVNAPPNEIQWMLKERGLENPVAFHPGYASQGNYEHFYCMPPKEYEFHLQSSPVENDGYFVLSVDDEQYNEGPLKHFEVDYIHGACGDGEARFEFVFETGKRPDTVRWSLMDSSTGDEIYSGGPWGLFAGRSLSFFWSTCLDVNVCYTMLVESSNYDIAQTQYVGLSDDDGGGHYEVSFDSESIIISSFPEGNEEATTFGQCNFVPQEAMPTGVFGCFSGSSLVELENGKRNIRMQDAQIGDAVLTQDGSYEEIYSFGHINPKQIAEFVQLQTKSTTLELTSDHLLWLKGGFIPASLVKVGDILSNGEAIVKRQMVQRRGVYAPFTSSGTIVVNDVVCSTYITMQPDSAYMKVGIFVTPISWHWMDWMGEQLLLQLNLVNNHPQQYTVEGISVVRGAVVLPMVKW
eukprot:CAMPEP_0194201202 /NCGR_PEP_ID=MMETSP0156-20130528/1530_1 /TAXON_ID=33649 /ORGANISM="Thalassionema nitzschioides, Strain L26-B" /LENGTH=1078 /DNA_ID=CAMNT_0038926333 /DNA_START=277 /DNA_END=3510 /DNA_ORIENTATION=+